MILAVQLGLLHRLALLRLWGVMGYRWCWHRPALSKIWL